VSPRQSARSQPCSEADAAARLRNARKLIEVAELVAGEGDDVEYASQATALAVLAGIAASDAGCCKALGRRSRGQDHRAAVGMVEEIRPGGKQAAQGLSRLLDVKDEAHYALSDVAGQKLKAALRQANDLITFAQEVLQR
jgi:hypothetical protein